MSISFICTAVHKGCEQAARFKTAPSYGAAFIFSALMRYWSFSFGEGAEQSPDSRNAASHGKWRCCYATLETVDYAVVTTGRDGEKNEICERQNQAPL